MIDDEEWALYDHRGTRVPYDTVEETFAQQESLEEEVVEFTENLEADISLDTAVRRVPKGEDIDDAERRYIDQLVAGDESDTGGDGEKLSVGYGRDDEGFGGDSHLFPAGYGQIAEGLSRGLDIRLSQQVVKVEYGDEGVKVTTANDSYQADRAVVTLPLGVLKKGNVQFVPPLPQSKQDAIARLDMGRLDKIILKFPKVFWPRDVTNIAYASDIKGEFAQFLNGWQLTGEAVLVSIIGGKFDRQLESLPDKEVQAQAMKVLRKMFGNDIPDPIGIRYSRWGKDPFACGCYSYVPLGATSDDYEVMSEPVSSLFFAGEATSRDYRATVHGAFLSGVREAKRIRKLA